MNHKTIRLIGVLFAIVCIASGGMLVAHAQETGDGSASIEYDYDNTQLNYELNEELFEPYNLQTLSDPETNIHEIPEEGFPTSSTNVQWAQDGTTLYWNNGNTMYQLTVTEPYNLDTLDTVDTQDTPGSGNIADFLIGNNGQTLIYNPSTSADEMHQVSLSNAHDITSMATSDDATVTIASPFESWDIVNNGQTMYGVTGDGTNLYHNNMTTPWDITTFESTVGSWDNQPLPNQLNAVQFINDNDESAIFNWKDPDELARLNIDTEGSSYSIVQTKDVGNMNSFTIADSGTRLFVERDRDFALELDSYTMNEYNATIVNGDGETLISLPSVNQSGSISYESEVRQDNVELQWYAVSNNTYSGSSNEIDILPYSSISIRDEQTNELITQPVNVTAYGEDSGIYSLDTSDGEIDITGLPNQSYTFSVDATGYTLRNKYAEQLGNIESLYLLANDTERVTTQFLLEDTTNTFTSGARLVIERSIEGNGNEWEEIYSDSFGVEGVSPTLQEGIRYRISIENDEIRRTIGPYRASIAEQVTINPDSGEIGVDSEGGWSIGANYDDDHINVRYTDPEDMTDSVSVTIHERGNESNTIIEGDTYTNPQDLRAEYQVPPQYNESNWIVSLEVTRGGETTVISMQVGPTLDTVPTELDPMWRNIISVIVILTFGLAFSALNRAVGAIVLALVGGALWWVGWLAGATAGVLITAYLFIAIGYGIYTKTVA